MSTTPTSEDEAGRILAFGYHDPAFVHDVHVLIGEDKVAEAKAALSAYIQRKIEQNDRKTLEAVASMTGGGSSPQEALDTIQFYAHNKLLVINGRLTPPPSKEAS